MRGEGNAMRNIPAAKWLELMRLVAGAWGMVLLMRAVEGAAVDLRLALPAAALFAALAWLPGLRPLRGWRRWSGAALALLGFGLLLALPAVRAEFAGLAAVLRGAQQGTAATRAAIVLGGGLALLAALCEGALRLHALACAPAVLALLSAPLFGIDPGAPAVFLLFAFLLAVPLPGGGAGRLRALRLPALALAAAFAASAVLSALGAEGVYQAVYRAEGWVQRSMQRMSGGSAAVSNGTVRRGNLYPAGTAQLSVTLDRAPQETVYLRGFTGGDYLGGAWAPADDEAIFQRMEENWLHWDEWADWIPGLYRSLYYAMNYSTVRPDWPEPRRMDIQVLVETEQAFSPYFSMESLWNPRRGEEHHYSFRYYEQGEMGIDWDSLPGSLNATRDWYRETQDAYIAEIAPYTVLPAEGLDRLRALAAENPVHDAVQATEFVRAAGGLHPDPRPLPRQPRPGGVLPLRRARGILPALRLRGGAALPAPGRASALCRGLRRAGERLCPAGGRLLFRRGHGRAGPRLGGDLRRGHGLGAGGGHARPRRGGRRLASRRGGSGRNLEPLPAGRRFRAPVGRGRRGPGRRGEPWRRAPVAGRRAMERRGVLPGAAGLRGPRPAPAARPAAHGDLPGARGL